jgi:hypothetical protein
VSAIEVFLVDVRERGVGRGSVEESAKLRSGATFEVHFLATFDQCIDLCIDGAGTKRRWRVLKMFMSFL